MINQLHADWAALVDDGPSLRGRWADDGTRLGGCVELDDVLAAINADPDGCLSALLQHHQSGDRLAGRVVLQALIPGFRRLARVYRCGLLADYLAGCWCVMASIDLHRRTRRLAANLLWDTHKLLRDEQRRSEQVPRLEWAPVPARDVSADSVITSAQELRLLDATTSAVLRSVYAEGLSGQEAAERHATSPQAIRWRCSKYVRRLAEHREELWAACA